MTDTQCRAKDPSTCWKHGSGISTLNHSRAEANAKSFLKSDTADGRAALDHARTLAYFGDNQDSPLVQRLTSANPIDVETWEKWDVSNARSKEVLEFEKKYSKEKGGGFNPQKETEIKKHFGFSGIRYAQILRGNPVVQDAQKQIEADTPPVGTDFISARNHTQFITKALQTEFFGGTKTLAQPFRTARQQQEDFDMAEAIVEREQQEAADNRHIWNNASAESRAKAAYYTPRD